MKRYRPDALPALYADAREILESLPQWAWVIHPIPLGHKFGRLPTRMKIADSKPKQPRLQIMKNLIPVVVIATFVLVGCDKQKSAIEDTRQATKNAIDNQKEAVEVTAKEDKKQVDVDAAVEKAKIEANKVADQAQLDADKQKADAKAAFEKARVDAENK
jgi:hypothetical protein